MEIRSTLGGAFRLLFLSSCLFCLGWFLSVSHKSLQVEEDYHRTVAAVPVIPPDTAPVVSQKSIDLAIAMFGIDIPHSAKWPKLDKALEDRGLTTRGAFMHKAEVTIGPAAFASWSLLGSTLAHELEVHCQQNFLFIYLMDMVGLDGTGEAERQAYRHELLNAKRFGLPGAERVLIAETMDYYYPDFRAENKGWSLALRAWMARNLLGPTTQI